jgi:hypothetical protein
MIVLQGAKERVEVLQFSPDGRGRTWPFDGQRGHSLAVALLPSTVAVEHPQIRSPTRTGIQALLVITW